MTHPDLPMPEPYGTLLGLSVQKAQGADTTFALAIESELLALLQLSTVIGADPSHTITFTSPPYAYRDLHSFSWSRPLVEEHASRPSALEAGRTSRTLDPMDMYPLDVAGTGELTLQEAISNRNQLVLTFNAQLRALQDRPPGVPARTAAFSAFLGSPDLTEALTLTSDLIDDLQRIQDHLDPAAADFINNELIPRLEALREMLLARAPNAATAASARASAVSEALRVEGAMWSFARWVPVVAQVENAGKAIASAVAKAAEYIP
jgi:hypothetical protein